MEDRWKSFSVSSAASPRDSSHASEEACLSIGADAVDSSVGKLPAGLRCLMLQLHDDEDGSML